MILCDIRTVTCLNIRFLRHLHGHTQKEFASMLNMSRTTYSSIERGERELTFMTALRIANIYGIDVGLLADPSLQSDILFKSLL